MSSLKFEIETRQGVEPGISPVVFIIFCNMALYLCEEVCLDKNRSEFCQGIL
jgi:hypothetical protein